MTPEELAAIQSYPYRYEPFEASDGEMALRAVPVTQEEYDALVAEVRVLRGALEASVATSAELRRRLHPSKGCGYRTYRQVWDASAAADVDARAALDHREGEG